MSLRRHETVPVQRSESPDEREGSCVSGLAIGGAACPGCDRTGAEKYLRAPDRFHGRDRLYQLLRCPSCGLVWLQDPPPPWEMGQHYGEDYERAISQAGQAPGFWASRRETILHYKSGGAVLDLGCSSGGFLAAMKGPTWKLYGIEMSERTAREAERNSGGQVFAGDILDAPFPSESFEVITCFHVLEHLHKPRQVLARAYDWLRPGGVFYVMVPNIRSAGARLFRSYWYALEIPRHLFHFSPDTLSALARSVGLQGMSITTHRHLFVEASVRYILDGLFAEVGIHRAPMAQGKPVSFLRKVLRKGFRVGVLPVLERLAAVVGEGESIFAVFAKN